MYGYELKLPVGMEPKLGDSSEVAWFKLTSVGEI